MVLTVKTKKSTNPVDFTKQELNLLTNLALILDVCSIALAVITGAIGVFTLNSRGNSYGIILYVSLLVCIVACWMLRPFWALAVRHLGGAFAAIEGVRLAIMRWLKRYYCNSSYRAYLCAQLYLCITNILYIIALANSKVIFGIIDGQSTGSVIAIAVCEIVVILLNIAIFLGSYQISDEESDVTVKHKD